MKSSVLITTVVVSLLPVLACGGGQTSAPPAAAAADVEKVIAQQERDWVAAIIAKDAATINRLLDDGFSGTTDDQRYSKAEAVQGIFDANYETLDLDNVEVHVFGDTAIVTMGQTEKGRHGRDPFSGRYLFTNVWVKRDGQWRAVASHGSSVR